MATITERSGRFTARVRLKGFPPQAKTFARRADAVAWGRRLEVEMSCGRWVEPNKAIPTLRSALQQYRTHVASKLKGSETYAYWFDEIADTALAGKSVDAVTQFDLAAWRDAQAGRGLAAGTVVRKMGLLSGVFTWAHKERGWITGNPMHSVRKPRVSDARERIISAEELAYLRRAAETGRAAEWLPDVLVVLLRSAMRRGEVFGLRRDVVDFPNAVAVLVDTKNGHGRQVPLCPEALAALRRLDERAQAAERAELVPLAAPGAITLAFQRTVERARRAYLADCAGFGVVPSPDFLVGIRLHDARHTAVTAWAKTGALSISELRQVSGHRDSRSLNRYINLKASDLAEKMAAMAASLGAKA